MSYNFGAGKKERVKQAFRCQFIACTAYASTLWLLMMIFPQVFAGIFSSDAALIDYTVWAMRIYMAGIFSRRSDCLSADLYGLRAGQNQSAYGVPEKTGPSNSSHFYSALCFFKQSVRRVRGGACQRYHSGKRDCNHAVYSFK